VSTHSDNRLLSSTLRQAVARGGEPLIRRGVDMAMRMMGEQFVTGETIDQALVNARETRGTGARYSYDMLGEAAMTADDARALPGRLCARRSTPSAPRRRAWRHRRARHLDQAVGPAPALRTRQGRAGDGELYPRLLQLAQQACGLTTSA
jgi:RHH-type proline utilization regulon transcriptional repressor/proline dehydrogenase/delta 1-pyrroline-5-carboxylate dehydrogenase